MNLIVCIDDRNGLSFNNRRQSRDVAVYERIISIAEGKRLWMSPYSAGVFQNMPGNICACDDYLQRISPGEYVFVELQDPQPLLERVSRVYLFRWNKVYPQDRAFPIAALNASFNLIHSERFIGNSHPELTLEVYA